jgi:hypothetical protein
MKKITIYTLVGCPYCEKFKDNLKSININFIEKQCIDHENECSELEYLSRCDLYPMCKIENSDGTLILCMPDEYKEIGKIIKLEHNKKIILVHSIDNMLQFIKNT